MPFAAQGQEVSPASPEPAISPAPIPPVAQPVSPTPAPAVTPGAAMSGTAPGLTGTAAAVSGTAAVPSPTPVSPYTIEIDLEKQRAYLLKDGTKIAVAPISSGRVGHLTPTGNFAVIEKDLNHFSNLYGQIVEKGSGRVVKSGADVATAVPKGCKFKPAPMKWFIRFDGASGMHAGILPGYPASHGCVRMPASKAQLFYQTVEVGTPVHVFGTAPERSAREEAPLRHPTVTTPKATPTPTPRPKSRRGLWPF